MYYTFLRYLLSFLFVGVHLFAVVAQKTEKTAMTIYRGNSKLGTIDATKTVTGTSTKYEVVSDATFRVIWSYTRKTDMQVEYRSGRLHHSVSKVYFKGKLDEMGQTIWKGDRYKCIRYPEDTFYLDQKITFSASMLYFREPKGVSKVYAENYLEYCPLEVIEPGKYKLTLPGGKENHYTYKNGVLQQIDVPRTGFSLVFKRRE